MKVLARLTVRERVLMIGGAALLLVPAAWFYLWQPIAEMQGTQEARIARYLALIDLARDAELAPLAQTKTEARSTPLAQRVTQSSETAGIPLARLDPDGRRLRVTVAEAPYADLIAWIAALETQSGVRALSVEVSRLTAPGTVSLRITLEDAT
ncbi:type II secretion system protein M [Sulfitobacter mediterraneus]|uniref:type II secretion system protein GspM n=1 Tax=Sulfitobacter mediterraneus TaxID=83219 RepID=UPI00193425C8|nr:type II secretion system protein M [Sulfitobacter mediterraneus]MBM1635195.1 type II secretion system protein M [Sulfitobacter mediterraneus]MBM1643046.1 type II secretion system protein M [Sulfitobacter mediterraneus]MBM1647094.1 type II secretion system protein M [Sulfitobacter mediterraneus]MBM1651136.1 type II secretion system protein M [Sulfitobacter mediterraneus]MBM1655137.1 type II secretion system protein M [Sulfitobacter mediterraneus]